VKTKPFVLVLLVITALVVSAGSALVVGRFSRHQFAARAALSRSGLVQGIVTGVAKAAVRMLVCRL